MIFVPFALPGERVSARIVTAHQRWARALLVEVVEPCAERIPPRCRHFTHCGGCHYQHMSYEGQLQAKAGIVAEQLRRIGGFESAPIQAAVASPTPWNYRNHVQFSLTVEGKLGFVAASGEGVFAIEECHLLEQPLVDLWPRLNVTAVPGLERVALRAGVEEDLLVVLHGEGDPEVEVQLYLPASVVWLGPGGAAVLAGDGHLVIEVLGRPYRVSAGSFFQVNSSLVAELVSLTMEALEVSAGEVVFDLYAGVGLFSAALAERGARLVAVEGSRWACDDFRVNLDEFEDVALYQAPVLQALPAIGEKPDAVLVDPPRAGLGRDVLDLLLEAGPQRLVYVSCDPATLARDGKGLAQAGYSLERVTPLDMFPQTFHIESVSLWRR